MSRRLCDKRRKETPNSREDEAMNGTRAPRARIMSAFHPGRPLGFLALTLVLILLFAASPLISVALSMAVASGLGCVLNEGDAHPCPFLGIDLGYALYDLFVMGWFFLVTIPVGAVLLIGWLIAAIGLAFARLRAR